MTQATLFVLDGTAALFRGYFGMGGVRAPDGLEVGGLLGLGLWVSRFLKEVRPTYVAAVMDTPQRTFRHVIAATYKANRPAPPADLLPQFPLAPRVVEALGVKAFQVPGYEADDLMATLARRGREAGVRTVLVSTDKDVTQLVDDHVSVMDPRDFTVSGPAEVERRMGVPPSLVADLLALAGDSTDNVPGVKGIGTKTAVALLRAMGSLESLFARVEEVSSLKLRGAASVQRRLVEGREAAELSLRLVRLHEGVPLPEGLKRLGNVRFRGPAEDAETIFERLGFHQPLRVVRALARRQAET